MLSFDVMKRAFILLLLVNWQACLPAQGVSLFPTVFLEKGFKVLGKGGEIGVWHQLDKNAGPLSNEEIADLPESLFKPWRRERFQFGFPRHPHWFRFQLTDTTDRTLTLELDNPQLSELYFFQVTNGEFDTSYIAGSIYPYVDSLRPYRNFSFPIEISAGDTAQCYLYLPYSRSQLDFKLFLWESNARQQARQQESLVLNAFFSAVFFYLLMLGMAIYLTRLRYFWYYFLYVLLVGAFIYSDIGAGFRNVWPRAPWLQQVAVPMLANLYLIAGLKFILAHFRTRRDYPHFDFVLRALIWLAAGMIAIFLLSPATPLLFAHLVFYFNHVLYIAAILTVFGLGSVALWRKDKAFPGWLLVGFLAHGLHIIYMSLEGFGLLPPLSLTSALAEYNLLLTFHTPLILMASLLIEMGIVLFIGVRYFRRLDADGRKRLRDLALQKQENLTALGMGMEIEQRRIAQELHDGLGGGLSALKFKLEHLKSAAGENVTLQASISQLYKDLTRLHQELRTTTRNLMPKPLYELGLQPAIQQLIEQTEQAAPHLVIHFHHNADFTHFNETAKIFLFRIVQELLNNLLKHAQATEACLQFVQHEQELLLTFEDNGRGFDVASALRQQSGIGLSNLRYRVEDALQGKLHIDSSPGRGTTISIEIPGKSLSV